MWNTPVKQQKKSVCFRRKNQNRTTDLGFVFIFGFVFLEKLLDRDRFFDAESAKGLGLIDKVLEHPIQDNNQDNDKTSKNWFYTTIFSYFWKSLIKVKSNEFSYEKKFRAKDRAKAKMSSSIGELKPKRWTTFWMPSGLCLFAYQ